MNQQTNDAAAAAARLGLAAAPTGAATQPPAPDPASVSVGDMLAAFQALQKQMAAQAEELAALRAAQTGETEPPDRSTRTYFHRNPGSTIILHEKLANGGQGTRIVQFNPGSGELTTDDPAIHAFLKPLLSVPGSPISLREDISKVADPLLKAAAQEVIASAERSIDRMGGELGAAPH